MRRSSRCSHEQGALVDLLDACYVYRTDYIGEEIFIIIKQQQKALTFFAVGHEVEVGHAPIDRALRVSSQILIRICPTILIITLLFTMSLYVIGDP
jgi:hypothetical protein